MSLKTRNPSHTFSRKSKSNVKLFSGRFFDGKGMTFLKSEEDEAFGAGGR